MIEMTYATLVSPPFQSAFRRLMTETVLPVQTSLKVTRLYEGLKKELNTYASVAEKTAASHDKKSTPGYMQEMRALHAEKFQLDQEPLSFADLGELKLTPAELLALKPVLSE